MKIDGSRPVAPARPAARKSRGEKGGRPAAAARAQPAADAAHVMGIPEGELTPKVRAAIVALMDEVESMRDQLDQSMKRIAYLEELADRDSLLPVINRRAFVRELSRMMSYVERYGTANSILFFDINDMKTINDTYGHAAGDAALLHVAEILLASVRESDVVGRLGGDEFGVILAQVEEKTAGEKAASLAEAIRKQPLVWEGKTIHLAVASGAHTVRGGEDAGKALHAADRAMYATKPGNSRPSDS